jgi:hypothetical protein
MVLLMEMDQDELMRKLEALRPEIVKIMRQHGVHEPDWRPLEDLLMGHFMFMGYYEGGIRAYKHKLTRRYLHLDPDLRVYRFDGKRYVPMRADEAISAVFEELDDLRLPQPEWPR